MSQSNPPAPLLCFSRQAIANRQYAALPAVNYEIAKPSLLEVFSHPSHGETLADTVQIQFDPSLAEADTSPLWIEL
jgi:hypothetical protein